jgi:hypothetical protein
MLLMSFYYSYNYVMNAFCRFEIYTLFDWYLIVISRKAFQIREFIFFHSSFLIEIKSRYFAWFRTLKNKNQRKQVQHTYLIAFYCILCQLSLMQLD